jgi:periplasmic protein TonB
MRIVMLRTFTWLISVVLHGAVALLFFLPGGGAALEQGSAHDFMVVEQGIAIEGIVKLGNGEASSEPVPVQMSEAASPPEEVKPIEETEVIASKEGPEQNINPEPKPEQIKQPTPPQVATLEQETAVEEQQSSSQARLGGDTTAQSAYLGALSSRLERSKISPHSGIVGTVVVHFVVDAFGNVVSREVSVSSGHKVLDDVAVASIDKAAPFPPMPKGLNRNQIDVSVPFRFSVR